MLSTPNTLSRLDLHQFCWNRSYRPSLFNPQNMMTPEPVPRRSRRILAMMSWLKSTVIETFAIVISQHTLYTMNKILLDFNWSCVLTYMSELSEHNYILWCKDKVILHSKIFNRGARFTVLVSTTQHQKCKFVEAILHVFTTQFLYITVKSNSVGHIIVNV